MLEPATNLPVQLATTNAGRRAEAKSKVLLGERFTVHMVTILIQTHTLSSPSSKGHLCDRVPSISAWFMLSKRVGRAITMMLFCSIHTMYMQL